MEHEDDRFEMWACVVVGVVFFAVLVWVFSGERYW
jgi:hypothetical protein